MYPVNYSSDANLSRHATGLGYCQYLLSNIRTALAFLKVEHLAFIQQARQLEPYCGDHVLSGKPHPGFRRSSE